MRLETASAILLGLFLLLAPLVSSIDPVEQHRDAILAPPSAVHWFGTDDYGRDQWARFCHGGRWSASVGAAAAALCLLLAWILGGVAGMLPRAGMPIMWLADLFLSLPWLYLLIAVRAALPLDLSPRAAFAALMTIVACTSWARPARLVRGHLLEARERGYVQAALGFGVPRATVFVRHILPSTLDLGLAQAILLLPRFILAELTLSFLGAGVSEPTPSWGGLIVPLKQVYLLDAQYWRLMPMLAMIPFFGVFALCGRAVEIRFRPSR